MRMGMGIRPNGHWPYHHLGRETFLAPVTWDADGWPVIGDGGRAALEMTDPESPAVEVASEKPAVDSFDQAALGIDWNFLRNPDSWRWSLSERPGWLRLYGSAAGLKDVASPAWIGRRQGHFDQHASTRLIFDPQAENEEAGLGVWMNERHHYEIILTQRGNQRCVVVRRRIGSLSAEVACVAVVPGPLVLSLQASRERYIFRAAGEGEAPVELAQAETRYVSTAVAGGFTGVYLALYATGNGAPCASPADFDYIQYELIE
jgi:xylan 1,4-beta-xylosidase